MRSLRIRWKSCCSFGEQCSFAAVTGIVNRCVLEFCLCLPFHRETITREIAAAAMKSKTLHANLGGPGGPYVASPSLSMCPLPPSCCIHLGTKVLHINPVSWWCIFFLIDLTLFDFIWRFSYVFLTCLPQVWHRWHGAAPKIWGQLRCPASHWKLGAATPRWFRSRFASKKKRN